MLIIPAFIFLYGWSRVAERGSIPNVIAKVGRTPITWTEYEIQLQEYMSLWGDLYSDDFEKQAKNQVLEGLIERILLKEEAKKRGIKVSDDEIASRIREYFKDEKGQFDDKIFLLFSDRYPEKINLLEENFRMQFIIEKLRNEVGAPVEVSEDEAYQYFLTSDAQVKIKYISLNPDNLRENLQISEDELMEYYEKNIDSFKDGPWRKIEYILISAQPTEGTDINTDTEIEEMLKDNAFNVSLKLLDEDDWRSFAEKEGLFYGVTGYFSREEPLQEFNGNLAVNDTTFSIKLSEVSEPLKVEKGYLILRPFVSAPQYRDVADKIRRIVEDERVKDLADKTIENILSELQEGKTAEEIVKNYPAEIKESGYFSRQGFIGGIGYAPEIAQAAFSSPKDKWSKANTITGETFIIQTEDIREPTHEKFQEKKQNITETLLQQKQQEFFVDWVKNLKEKNKNRIVILWDELKQTD